MHVIDGLGRGGAERVLVELANQFARLGHGVQCCVTRTDISLACELDRGIPVNALGRTRRVDRSAFREFGRMARDVDLLHVHSRSTLGFLAAVRLTGSRLPPVVFHDHFGGEGRLPFWLAAVGPRLIAEYVAVAPRLAGHARRSGFPVHRLSVIGNGLSLHRLDTIPTAQLRELLSVAKGAPLGICVCGIRKQKGVDLLIRALAAAARDGTRIFVAIVGKDADPKFGAKCRELAGELGVADQVLFLGERADAAGLMRSADFGVIPSRSESGPLTLIECLAARIPVVSSLTGEIADRAARAGVTGMVPPGDVDALTEALVAAASLDLDARVERGRLGRAIAEDHFEVEQLVPTWTAVYERAARHTTATQHGAR